MFTVWMCLPYQGLFIIIKGGYPGAQATRQKGLTKSHIARSYNHATHLTGTVSGLHWLNKQNGQPRNFFLSYFSLLHRHGSVLCLR